jgi:hypothetical protein
VTGDVVPTAPHCQRQILLAGEVNSGDNIIDNGTAYDQGRIAIDHAVPHPARLIVAGVAWSDHLTVSLLRKPRDMFVAELRSSVNSFGVRHWLFLRAKATIA